MQPKDTVIYTAQKSGLKKGPRYANPRFFDGKPKRGVKKVVVVGDWPAVVDAYEAAGVEVVTEETPRPKTFTEARVEKSGRDVVEIPDDWQEMSWQDKRKLAAQLSDVPVINSAGADAAIMAELDRRA
ncbi:hypothetical protein [Methyloceanibacter caenitepidi]|uniref:Uncharacterized protein n=1 Tax=Methyloceanibacter caenitepidi TaxID=1384459 RepID=A0A0A8K5U4_9HYPH|nr:hypothetical protein [Methyloceanibacter caenitepidi]BAQ18318.1 hypothetical protein GL4_2885 [Methyloceanibacter caenitepidi]